MWGANVYLMKEDIDNYEKVRDIETSNPKISDPHLKVRLVVQLVRLHQDNYMEREKR